MRERKTENDLFDVSICNFRRRDVTNGSWTISLIGGLGIRMPNPLEMLFYLSMKKDSKLKSKGKQMIVIAKQVVDG